MGRVSQAQAQENRARVVATASRLFREHGTGVSVADLMQAAGLTQGGFYKQFASKEALVEEAAAHAFTELTARRTEGLREHEGRPDAARQALVDHYLTPRHRDDAGGGCPVAALAADMARDPGEAARGVYTEGVREFADWLADDEQDGLARLATLVGGLLLARATEGSELSDEILRAAHAALSDGS